MLEQWQELPDIVYFNVKFCIHYVRCTMVRHYVWTMMTTQQGRRRWRRRWMARIPTENQRKIVFYTIQKGSYMRLLVATCMSSSTSSSSLLSSSLLYEREGSSLLQNDCVVHCSRLWIDAKRRKTSCAKSISMKNEWFYSLFFASLSFVVVLCEKSEFIILPCGA